jgi:hypothetical protein
MTSMREPARAAGRRSLGAVVGAIAFSAALGGAGGCRHADDPPAPAGTSTSELTPSGDTRPSQSDIDRLRTLGYVDFVEEKPRRRRGGVGVVLHDKARSMPGYNFFESRILRRADIVDAAGSIVHARGAGDVTCRCITT